MLLQLPPPLIEGQYIVVTDKNLHSRRSLRSLSDMGVEVKTEWGPEAALAGFVAKMTPEQAKEVSDLDFVKYVEQDAIVSLPEMEMNK